MVQNVEVGEHQKLSLRRSSKVTITSAKLEELAPAKSCDVTVKEVSRSESNEDLQIARLQLNSRTDSSILDETADLTMYSDEEMKETVHELDAPTSICALEQLDIHGAEPSRSFVHQSVKDRCSSTQHQSMYSRRSSARHSIISLHGGIRMSQARLAAARVSSRRRSSRSVPAALEAQV